MDNLYNNMCFKLRTMDEKQLLELWHDVGDIDAIQRISDTAYHFTENYDYEATGSSEHVMDASHYLDVSDEKQVDDSQRLKDIKAEQSR